MDRACSGRSWQRFSDDGASRRIRAWCANRTLTSPTSRPSSASASAAPARSIVDLAQRLSDRRLARAINDLRLRRLLSLEALERQGDRRPHRPGTRRVAPAADEFGRASASPAESRRARRFEDDWIRFAVRHGLPDHEMNVHVCGHRVDVLFAPERLIVELDGWATHSSRAGVWVKTATTDADSRSRRSSHDPDHARAFRSRPAEQARLIRQVLGARRTTPRSST